MKTQLQLAAILLIATFAVAQTPVVPGSILGSLTPITTANGTLNAVFPVVINTGAPAVLVQLDQTTTITAGAIRFRVSYDGTNFVNTSTDAVTDPTSTSNATISMPYTLVASTNKAFLVNLKGAQALQILVSTAMTGTGAITPYYSVLPMFMGNQGTGLNMLGGSAVSTATTGVQKVGITGNAGAIFDAAGDRVTAPANELIVGGHYTHFTNGQISSGNVSALQLNQLQELRVMPGGDLLQVISSTAATSQVTSSVFDLSSAFGTATISYDSITGSPSSCTLRENVADSSTGTLISTWTSSTLTVGTLQNFAVNANGQGAAANMGSAWGVTFSFVCSVYPSGGTITVEFVPSQGVTIAGANGNALTVNTSGALSATAADGDLVTLGAKADAKSTSTDTTAITAMSVLKEISAMEQAPASRAVTNAGTFAVQDTLQAGTAIAGKFGIDQTTPGTTNAFEMVPDTSSSVALTTAVKLTVTSSVSVKASAGNVYGVSANNGAAAVCWVQFTNSAGAGTLGSAVIFSVVMPASGTVNIPPAALGLANFSTGITVGIASVTNSSSACGTAGNVTVFYK